MVSLIAVIAVLLTGNNVKYAQSRLPSLLPRSSFVSLRRRLVENRLSWTRRRFATFQRSRRVSQASRSFFSFFFLFFFFFEKVTKIVASVKTTGWNSRDANLEIDRIVLPGD